MYGMATSLSVTMLAADSLLPSVPRVTRWACRAGFRLGSPGYHLPDVCFSDVFLARTRSMGILPTPKGGWSFRD